MTSQLPRRVWDGEKAVDDRTGESLREEIRDFISRYHAGTLSFMLTLRRNGTPVMRPVSTFVEGWTIGTISQHHQVKVQHVRNNPTVGYLFVDAEGPPYMSLGYTKNVWVAGTAELIEDPEEVADFFRRREAATGQGDAHPHDQSYTRLLFRTTPTYLRAEGFAEHARPVILTSFD